MVATWRFALVCCSQMPSQLSSWMLSSAGKSIRSAEFPVLTKIRRRTSSGNSAFASILSAHCDRSVAEMSLLGLPFGETVAVPSVRLGPITAPPGSRETPPASRAAHSASRLFGTVVRRQGLFEAIGFPREYFVRLHRQGKLNRPGRGICTLPDANVTKHHSYAEMAKRVAHATVCLLSALVFHEITTQSPASVWIALHKGARTPVLTSPSLRIVRLSGPLLTEGIEKREFQRFVH